MATAMATGTIMGYKATPTLVFLYCVLQLTNSFASGLKITPALDLTHIYTDNLNVRNEAQLSDQITELKANLNLRNQGAIVESNINYQLIRLEYADNSTLSKTFDNYQGQVLFKLLENRLNTTLSASKRRQQSSLTNPSTLYSGTGQTDVIQYNIHNQLNSKLANYLDYSVNWYLGQTQTDTVNHSEQTDFRDSDNQRLALGINSGDFFTASYWFLYANKTLIKHKRLLENNISKQTLTDFYAELGREIFQDISILAQYYDEDYDVSNIQSPSLTSSSYGLGLRWQPSSRSYIKLAYNWSLDDLNSNYVSAKLNWQPSQRTSLILSSSKRFFGNAYEASFNHRHRRISTSIVYTESITNFQTSSLTPTTLGHFICPSTPDFTIDQCTFAAGQTPTIGSGEQLIPIDRLTPELSNRTYLNKQLSTNVSYQFRKFNLLLSYRKNRRTNVDTNNRSIRESFLMTTSYRLNRHNRFNLGVNVEDTSMLSANNFLEDYQEKQYNLSYAHDFNSTMSATFSVLHRNRDSNNTNNDFNEDRVSLSLRKEF